MPGNQYGQSKHMPDGWFSALIGLPTSPILSLAVAKAHLRVDHSDEDDLITALVEAANDYLDAKYGVLGRALITQRWQMTLPKWPDRGVIELDVPPVQSVHAVTYYDADNVQQTVNSADYVLLAGDTKAIVYTVGSAPWPVAYDREDAISVQYDTGYGDESADLPRAIRQAALLLIGNWYENRESVTAGAMVELPMAVEALLRPFKTSRVSF